MTNWEKVHALASQLFDETRDMYRPDFCGDIFERARNARIIFEQLREEMKR
jgi:hypothetical protein